MRTLWLTIGMILAAQFAALPAWALAGRVVDIKVATAHVPGPVDVAVYLPPGYDPKRAEPYPLLLQLHGGGGSSRNMDRMAVLLERAIEDGSLPPVVSVMPSAGRSFYMDFRDGSQKWETFILADLLPQIRKAYRVAPGRQGAFVTGVSMGGMGSLRLAFKHPEAFQAVASQEPGIEPALAYDDIQLRDRFWRAQPLFEKIYGAPVDRDYWAANNPANIAKAAPERLRGLGVYIEAGDQDMFFLDHGTEFLHRILFDAGVAHEYRLVRGGDHVGPSIGPRFHDAMVFIGRSISPPAWTSTPDVQAARAQVDAMKRAAGYPVAPVDDQRIRTR